MTKSQRLGRELNDLWNENEKTMGEMAAYQVACEHLDIDPEDGWNLLYEYAQTDENKKACAEHDGLR